MQVQVTPYELPAEIGFNYDELKTELAEKLQHYETVVYNEDEIKDAKSDRANLNKLKDALDTERKNRKKSYLEPFETFEKQIKELVGMVDKATLCIDKQVKVFEDKKKDEKKEAIKKLWAEKDAPSYVTLEKIWNEKWLNASTRESAISKEIDERLAQIKNELNIIESLAHADEARVVYEQCLDLATATAESERIAKIQAAVQENKQTEPVVVEKPVELEHISISTEEKRMVVRFEAELTVDEALKLRDFCKSLGIVLKQI